MTGADILRVFYSKYDEITGSILDPSRLNDQFNQVVTEHFRPLFKEYGLTASIVDELSPLQSTFSVVNPVDYKISKTTNLPNYQAVTSVVTTYTYNGNTYTKTATYLPPNSMKGSFSDGKPHAPKYEIIDDIIQLYPIYGTLSKVEGDYFVTPPVIDVEDSVTELPFTDQTINGVINKMLSTYAASLRDDNMYNIGEREQRENTNVVTK